MPTKHIRDAIRVALEWKYESPIESALLDRVRDHAAPGVEVLLQVEHRTRFGRLRVDGLLISPEGRRIAIEADGEAYHDAKRDAFRDSLLLGNHFVSVVYRARGRDILRYVAILLSQLSRAEPWVFPDSYASRWHEISEENERRKLEWYPDETHFEQLDRYVMLRAASLGQAETQARYQMLRASRATTIDEFLSNLVATEASGTR